MINQLCAADFFKKPRFVQLLKKHVMNNLRSQRKSEKSEWGEGLPVEKAVLNQSNCLKMNFIYMGPCIVNPTQKRELMVVDPGM